MVIVLSSEESGRCVALVIVKALLWRISHCDMVPPSRMTGKILASTDFRVA